MEECQTLTKTCAQGAHVLGEKGRIPQGTKDLTMHVLDPYQELKYLDRIPKKLKSRKNEAHGSENILPVYKQ